jgi:hypothetical protein
MQEAKDLLMVVPVGPANLKPDLPIMNPSLAKPVRLILRNIVVQNNHAAVLLRGTTSLTSPWLVSLSASFTA